MFWAPRSMLSSLLTTCSSLLNDSCALVMNDMSQFSLLQNIVCSASQISVGASAKVEQICASIVYQELPIYGRVPGPQPH